MKKNFMGKLALFGAIVLILSTTVLGCSTSSDDDGDSKAGGAGAVYPIVTKFTPEAGANYIRIILDDGAGFTKDEGGSFKYDVDLSDFSFGDVRSSTFGTSFPETARLTKMDWTEADGARKVLRDIVISGLSVTDNGIGEQELTIKASALIIQPKSVIVETGRIPDVVVTGVQPVNTEDGSGNTDYSILVVRLLDANVDATYTTRFADKVLLSDFELLGNGDIGKYVPYAGTQGFTSLSGVTVSKDAADTIRLSNLPNTVPISGGTSQHLLIKAAALVALDRVNTVNDVTPLNRVLPDGTVPLVAYNKAVSHGYKIPETTNYPIGEVIAGVDSVGIFAVNYVFKPILTRSDFALPAIPAGGLEWGENVTVTVSPLVISTTGFTAASPVIDGVTVRTPALPAIATGTSMQIVVIKGLKKAVGNLPQNITINSSAWAYRAFNNDLTTVSVNADTSTGVGVASSQYWAKAGDNLLTIEVQNGGAFKSAREIANLITGTTNDLEPEREGDHYVLDLAAYALTSPTAVAKPSNVFKASTGALNTALVPYDISIASLKIWTNKIEVRLGTAGEGLKTFAADANKFFGSSVNLDAKVFETLPHKNGMTIFTSRDDITVTFTAADGQNRVGLFLLPSGTVTDNALFNYFLPTGALVLNGSPVAKENVRVAEDRTRLYITAPLALNNTLVIKSAAQYATVGSVATATANGPVSDTDPIDGVYFNAVPSTVNGAAGVPITGAALGNNTLQVTIPYAADAGNDAASDLLALNDTGVFYDLGAMDDDGDATWWNAANSGTNWTPGDVLNLIQTYDFIVGSEIAKGTMTVRNDVGATNPQIIVTFTGLSLSDAATLTIKPNAFIADTTGITARSLFTAGSVSTTPNVEYARIRLEVSNASWADTLVPADFNVTGLDTVTIASVERNPDEPNQIFLNFSETLTGTDPVTAITVEIVSPGALIGRAASGIAVARKAMTGTVTPPTP